MIIANPIFDVVFKRLMQNTRIVRFLIETLTEETLEDVELKPQEFVFRDEAKTLAVSRYDFIATIKTAGGEYKKVLIEIQKAKNAIDLMRFRNYLGEQYKKEDEIATNSGTQKVALPIITMYLLGFDLPGIDSPAVKVARNYTDLITHTIINKKSDFIEHLSHDCYVVQMSKIQTRVQTSLEQLLSVFEQVNFTDEKGTTKMYNHEIHNEVVRSMLDELHYAGTDPERRKEIENEQEAWRIIGAMGGDKIRELEQKLEENNKALELEKRVNLEKEKALEDERKAKETLAQELEALKRKLGLTD